MLRDVDQEWDTASERKVIFDAQDTSYIEKLAV